MPEQDGIDNAQTTPNPPWPPGTVDVDRFRDDPHDAGAWEAAIAALAPAGGSDALRAARDAYGASDVGRSREQARQELLKQVRDARPLKVRTDWTGAPPPRAWLVPDRIPAHRYGMLTGKGSAGKSRVALALARAVIGSETWLSWPVDESGPVVWATWEDEADEMARRLGIEGRGAVGRQLHVVDLAEYGPTWAQTGRTAGMAELTGIGRQLRTLCESAGAALLVIDPLAAAFAANENDRALVRAFCSSWDGWARRVRCTVLVVSHPPKSGDEAYAGSTDWEAAARWMARLRDAGKSDDRGDEADLSVLEWTKSNYGDLPSAAYLRWADTGGYVYDGEREPKPQEKRRSRKGEGDTPKLTGEARQTGLDGMPAAKGAPH